MVNKVLSMRYPNDWASAGFASHEEGLCLDSSKVCRSPKPGSLKQEENPKASGKLGLSYKRL